MTIEAQFPAFLRKEPLIWGIQISDLFRLSGVLVFMQFMKVSSMVMLATLIGLYFTIIAVRRFFPRRYFEFYFQKKTFLKMKELN